MFRFKVDNAGFQSFIFLGMPAFSYLSYDLEGVVKMDLNYMNVLNSLEAAAACSSCRNRYPAHHQTEAAAGIQITEGTEADFQSTECRQR